MSTPVSRPAPQPDAASAPFWDAAARHQLVIQRCAECNTFRHPPRPMCPSCHSMESRYEPSAGRGRIWSWVVAHPPVLPAFEDKAPYNVAVVELDEGVRMIGNVTGAPAAGMEVQVVFEEIEEGVALPQWKPI